MSFIRTVLGDIPPEALGACLSHEHLIIDPSYVTQLSPDLRLPSVENAVEELAAVRAAGGRAVVDCMPCDAGRNVLKLAEISRRSGLHVVAATGLHRTRYYPEGHWRYRLTAEELAETFVAEIEQGIDALDAGGPAPRRTPHRAGLVKLASDGPELSDAERAAFEAGAAAHRRSGVPVLTHCEAGRGPEQIDFLEARGVDPSRVILSHTDRHPDPEYHRSLLRRGVFLEYDRVFRGPLDDANPTLRLFVAMAREFPDRILLGTDAARPAYWRSYGGGPGLDYLLGEFRERARRLGASEEHLRRAFVVNPARAFAFRS